MEENLTRISSSKKDIYKKLLDIAGKYVDTENDDFLKTGLFGYITEAAAMMVRDSAIHKSMIYNESFLNTAIIPKSIYNWAKMFNIEVSKAVPAYSTVLFKIPLSAISDNTYLQPANTLSSDKYGAQLSSKGTNLVLILDKSNPIIAGNYYFSLEHSILLTYFQNSKGTTPYIAEYITTEQPTTNFQDLNTTQLETKISGNYLIIKARAYQYQTKTISRQITSSSVLNTKVHSFEFEDQLAGARLFYNKSGISEEVALKYSSIEDIDSEKFAYYNLKDTNELEIVFSSEDGGFIPSSNSTLELQLFLTKGLNVPSKFNGSVVFRLSEEDLRTLPIVAEFDPQDIIGGKNTPSLQQIKKTIINEISTRNAIVSETDLNNYFAILTALIESIGGGKLKFIRKRDDILKRTFEAYILMRDGENSVGDSVSDVSYISSCIPTNTIDAYFQVNENISKKFGSAIRKVNGTGNEIRYEYISDTSILPDNDFYIIPFYTRIMLNPFKRVKYMYNLTDDSSILSYSSNDLSENSSGEYTMIPSSVSIKRGISSVVSSNNLYSSQNAYSISFTFTTNFELTSNLADGLTLTAINENGITAGIFKDFVINENYSISSIESSDESGIYTTTLTFNLSVADDEFSFSNESSSDNYGTYINILSGSSDVVYQLSEKTKFILTMKDFPIVSNYSMNGEFISGDYLSLFRDLDDIMSSDITINYTTKYVKTDDSGTDISDSPKDGYTATSFISSLLVHDIPVVHASFFEDSLDNSNSANREENLIKQLFTYIDILKEQLGKLETNTFFDLKFYNTYGPSYYFNTNTTDIDLAMTIYLKYTSSGLEDEIRDYIRRTVDSVDGSLAVSYILAQISQNATYGNYISHISFESLNGEFRQYIEFNSNIDENKYAPEWLNLRKTSLENIKFVSLS